MTDHYDEKPGLEDYQDGKIIAEGFSDRMVIHVTYFDHPLLQVWEEYKITEGHGEERKRSDWKVSEDIGLNDVWVGHIPELVASICEVGLRFPQHIPGRNKNPKCWMRTVKPLTQEGLDNIKDFLILVGAIPSDSEFKLGEKEDPRYCDPPDSGGLCFGCVSYCQKENWSSPELPEECKTCKDGNKFKNYKPNYERP
jgi:hypothetical protein